MSTIAAGTTSGTALVSTGNTTGELQLQVNGTTPSVTLAANGSIGVGSSPGYGTNGQVLTSSGTGSAPTWTTPATPPAGITLGTPVDTTSGTSVDYTSLPAGLKRITVNFSSVSTNGGTQIAIQLGDSGGIEDTGYTSLMTRLADGSTVSSTTTSNGFSIYSTTAAAVLSGSVVINLENSTTNTWCAQGIVGNTGALLAQAVVSGRKSLSAELDRIRIAAGGDTFDAGQINISYE
jgi:hypothetical protein